MTAKNETKQFQYEIQSYQEDCVTNITGLFESLRQKVNFGEVLTAYHKKHKCSVGIRHHFFFPAKPG